VSAPRFAAEPPGPNRRPATKIEVTPDLFVIAYRLTPSGPAPCRAPPRVAGGYEFHTLKLTRSDTTGMAHCGYRTSSEEALMRRVAAIEKMGLGIGWTDGDLGHGPSYRFRSPDGHVFELYWQTNKYEAPDGEKPALKNVAQRYHARGVAPRRIDHFNLLATDVSKMRDFMVEAMGSRVTEMIKLDNGRIGGCWFTVNNKGYDMACTEDHSGAAGRFHHITYAADHRDDLLRAAYLFLENAVFIETGPHKHAIQGTFFLYVYEPAGNRVEVANAGARLILDPDWQPVVWTEAERRKGQAWGLKTIESFHTHGTPPVPNAGH